MSNDLSLTTKTVLPLRSQQDTLKGQAGIQAEAGSGIPSKTNESTIVRKASNIEDVLVQKKDEEENQKEVKNTAKEAENEKDVTEAVAELNQFVQSLDRELQFSIHKDSGKTVVKVVDAETDKVIRQIPSEEILAISESLENVTGFLLQAQA